MSQITKPLALDETLQQIAEKIDSMPRTTGKSAYYSAIDGGFIGSEDSFNTEIAKISPVINPNLLDNWYFVGGASSAESFPIYMRNYYVVPPGITYYTDSALTTVSGTTSDYYNATYYSSCGRISIDSTYFYVSLSDVSLGYNCTSNIYTIDRWKSRSGTIVIIKPDCLYIESDNSSISGLNQSFLWEKFAGKTLTLSVLVKSVYSDNEAYPVIGFFRGNSAHVHTSAMKTINIPSGGSGLYTLTCDIPETSTYTNLNIAAFMANTATTAHMEIIAAKLEFGDIQTLAHNEGTDENPIWVLNEIPNYNEQLLRCQNYYQLFDTSDIRPVYKEDFRPPMRVDPSRGSIRIVTSTKYYASADL